MLLCWPHPSALVAYNGGTNVGHGPVTTLFLSVVLCLVPMTPCDMIVCFANLGFMSCMFCFMIQNSEQNQAQETSPNTAMPNVSATIMGHQGTGAG